MFSMKIKLSHVELSWVTQSAIWLNAYGGHPRAIPSCIMSRYIFPACTVQTWLMHLHTSLDLFRNLFALNYIDVFMAVSSYAGTAGGHRNLCRNRISIGFVSNELVELKWCRYRLEKLSQESRFNTLQWTKFLFLHSKHENMIRRTFSWATLISKKIMSIRLWFTPSLLSTDRFKHVSIAI